MSQIIALRPTGASAAEHQAALLKIEALMAEASDRIETLKQARPKLLLTASPTAIQDVEQSISDGLVDIEQLQAMHRALLPELANAQAAETKAQIRALFAKSEAMRRDYIQHYRGRYELLIDELVALFAKGDAAVNALHQAQEALRKVPDIRDEISAEFPDWSDWVEPGCKTVLLKQGQPRFANDSGLFQVWKGRFVQ